MIKYQILKNCIIQDFYTNSDGFIIKSDPALNMWMGKHISYVKKYYKIISSVVL